MCPPEDAVPPEEALVIRLAKTPTPTAACFRSHAARGLPIRGDTSPCRHASCSVFFNDEKCEQLNAMRRLPHFRSFTHAFLLRVTPTSGLALAGAEKHLDLWMFKSFDPVAAVEEVAPM